MYLLIYITHPDEETAQKISGRLLEDKLVACANLFPIQSLYWWKGAIATEGEWVSIVKTQPEHWDALCILVERIHPYEVPCITRIEAHANQSYENWIISETEHA